MFSKAVIKNESLSERSPSALRVLICLSVFGWMITSTLMGQAPYSVAGRAVEATITEGFGIFASTGSFLLLISQSNDRYAIIPTSSGVFPSTGSGSYTWTDFSTARANMNDSTIGFLTAFFDFTSRTAGKFRTVSAYSDLFGYQKGSFLLYDGAAPDSHQGLWL